MRSTLRAPEADEESAGGTVLCTSCRFFFPADPKIVHRSNGIRGPGPPEYCALTFTNPPMLPPNDAMVKLSSNAQMKKLPESLTDHQCPDAVNVPGLGQVAVPTRGEEGISVCFVVTRRPALHGNSPGERLAVRGNAKAPMRPVRADTERKAISGSPIVAGLTSPGLAAPEHPPKNAPRVARTMKRVMNHP